MATYLISYDLGMPETSEDYQELINCIKSLGSTWAKPLYSVWLVKSSMVIADVRDALRERIDRNDRLFVVDVTGDASAWFNLPEEVATWLKAGY